MGCIESKAVEYKPSSAAKKDEIKPTKSVEKENKTTVNSNKPAETVTRTSNASKSVEKENKLNVSSNVVSTAASATIDTETPQWACFGAGCYWGTEKFIRYNFQKKFPKLGKIIKGEVGFMGPPDAAANPSYHEVCSGATGHVEVYNFQFIGGAPYYEELVKFFFQFHDPTTLNRQGNDRGTQYASVIYCENTEQLRIANRVKTELQELVNAKKVRAYQTQDVSTDIRMRTKFYPAHKEHQDYLMENPNGYCNHRIRFEKWPSLD